jgi:sulfite reductase beta subunit-like hemoprotein
VLSGTGTVRGLLSTGWTVPEIVEVLEKLEFTHHNPSRDLAMLGSAYRAPDAMRTLSSVLPEELDPYAIAAYLKLWHENSAGEYKPPPVFNVGVSYGSELSATAPFPIWPIVWRACRPPIFQWPPMIRCVMTG